jgi:hypothetical protein
MLLREEIHYLIDSKVQSGYIILTAKKQNLY